MEPRKHFLQLSVSLGSWSQGLGQTFPHATKAQSQALQYVTGRELGQDTVAGAPSALTPGHDVPREDFMGTILH